MWGFVRKQHSLLYIMYDLYKYFILLALIILFYRKLLLGLLRSSTLHVYE